MNFRRVGLSRIARTKEVHVTSYPRDPWFIERSILRSTVKEASDPSEPEFNEELAANQTSVPARGVRTR